MATLGEIRRRLQVFAPAFDLSLLSSFIADRYLAILDRLPWQRLEAQRILTTEASYAVGTAAVTSGSNAVTGTGTAWTAGMVGRRIRFGSEDGWYQVATVPGVGSLTLDRTYRGATAAGLAYRIDQSIYTLPAEMRKLESLAVLDPAGPVEIVSLAVLNELAPNRGAYGVPVMAALYMDSQTDPPLPQVEFYPTPETTLSIAYGYVYEPAAPNATASTVLPWVRTSAIEAGCKADICAQQKDYAGAAHFEALFEKHVGEMLGVEAQRRGSSVLRASNWMTRHNRLRWQR